MRSSSGPLHPHPDARPIRSHVGGSRVATLLFTIASLAAGSLAGSLGSGCTEQGQAGSACASDEACGTQEHCVSGGCVPKDTSDASIGDASTQCTTDLQCLNGQKCNQTIGICEARVSCTTDEPCGLTEHCNLTSHVCEAGERICTQESACTAVGKHCDLSKGRCVACVATLDCPDPKICSNNECVTPDTTTCSRDSECRPPLLVCESRACVPGCGTSDSPIVCSDGEVCDTSSGRCVVEPDRAPLGADCTKEADCASDVCFNFGGNVGKRCVEACGRSEDCPSTFACYDLHGAKMCLSAELFNNATFSKNVGTLCSSGLECQSNFCPNAPGLCVGTCSKDDDCGGGSHCQWIEHTPGEYIAACVGSGSGLPDGFTCASGADCASGVCYGDGRCGALCGSTQDCKEGSACAGVDYSECVLGTAAACSRWQANFAHACIEASLGTRAIGEPCSDSDICHDGFCDTDRGICTGLCSRDADCPSNFVCGVEALGTLSDGTTETFGTFCRPKA